MGQAANLKKARREAAKLAIAGSGGFRKNSVIVSQDIREARTDFTAFTRVLGYPPAPHMLEWHGDLITGKTEGPLIEIAGPPTKILSPRGSAKSATTCMFTAWALGRASVEGLLLRSMIISYALPVSRGKSGVIKRIIQSPIYQQIFPNVVVSKERTSDEFWHIDFDRAKVHVGAEDVYSVCATGILGAIVSKRVNLAILDDLIKSRKSIADPAVRREMIDNWSQLIYPCLFKDGTSRPIDLGTRFHWDDIHATTFNAENGWIEKFQKALLYDEDGNPCSYWEEKAPVATLLEDQKSDPVGFAYQMQNEAPRTGEAGIDRSLLKRVSIPDEYDEIAVGADLSSGTKEKHDFTVFVLAGIRDGIIYLIDYRRFKAKGNLEKVYILMDLLAEWNILTEHPGSREGERDWGATNNEVTVVPEEVAYQLSFQGDAEAEMHIKRNLNNVRFRGLPGRGDKRVKQLAVIGRIERGSLQLNRFRKWDPVITELINLGDAGHDDCADAVELVCRHLGRYDRHLTGSPEDTGDDAAERHASELVYPKNMD